MTEDIRWKQRFENFESAYQLLLEAVHEDVATLPMLSKEGVIQRFEYTYELAWKTLADYVETQGIEIKPRTPRDTFKQAFNAGFIDDGQVWIDMMDARNKLSHTYKQKVFLEALGRIYEDFFPKLKELYNYLKEKTE